MKGGGDFVCNRGIGDGGDVGDVEGGFEDFGGGEGARGEDEVDVGGRGGLLDGREGGVEGEGGGESEVVGMEEGLQGGEGALPVVVEGGEAEKVDAGGSWSRRGVRGRGRAGASNGNNADTA